VVDLHELRVTQLSAALLIAVHAMSLDDRYRHPQMHPSYVRRLIQTGGQFLLDLYPTYAELGLIRLLNELTINSHLMANWRLYEGTAQLIPENSIFSNGKFFSKKLI